MDVCIYDKGDIVMDRIDCFNGQDWENLWRKIKLDFYLLLYLKVNFR